MKSMVKFSKKKTQPSEPTLKARFGYVQALWRSFFDVELYLDVKERWRGLALRYVFLLSVLLAIPWAMNEGYNIQQYFKNTVLPCTKMLPDLMIRKGVFDFNKPSPYIIKNSKGVASIVLDNKADFNFLLKRYDEAFLIIHNDQFVIKLPKMGQQITRLDEKISGHLSRDVIIKRILDTKKLLFWTLYPTMAVSLFVVMGVFLFFFTLIAPFVTNVMMKYKLDYRSSFRVAAIAATPGFVVMLGFYIPGYGGSVLGLVTFSLFYGYYFYAVHKIKHARHDLVVQEDLSA